MREERSKRGGSRTVAEPDRGHIPLRCHRLYGWVSNVDFRLRVLPLAPKLPLHARGTEVQANWHAANKQDNHQI